MKLYSKLTALVLAIVLVLLAVPAMANPVSSVMPAEIQTFLSAKKFSSYTLSGTAEGSGWFFAMARSAKGVNTLYAFQYSNNAWKYRYYTTGAFMSTQNELMMYINESGYVDTDPSADTSKPALIITEYGPNHEMKAEIIFVYRDNIWKFTRYLNYEKGTSVRGMNNRLFYYDNVQAQSARGHADGVYERNLKNFSLSALPKTLSAAREKLCFAPAIPSYGDLQAEVVNFTSGKKYKVYQGPGERYGQAGNGKAVVSTNDWIQVFGQEGDWIMIQYDISSTNMRIGWIKASALPKNTHVNQLVFVPLTAQTTALTSMTDDPLYTRSAVMTIPAGASVTWLASMGEWAYVEYASGTAVVRGFVGMNVLSTAEAVNE